MATWTPCTLVFRSWLMSLIITFMFEPAKLQMNCARASGTSTPRSALVDPTPVSVSMVTSQPNLTKSHTLGHHPSRTICREGRSEGWSVGSHLCQAWPVRRPRRGDRICLGRNGRE